MSQAFLGHTAPAALSVLLLSAVSLLSSPARGQILSDQTATTTGACSPALINSSGVITINCGVNGQELVPMLNELLARHSRDEIVPTLQEIKKILERLRVVNSGRRAKLASLGISWSQEAFGDALLREDIPALELFLSGPTPMNLYGPYKGGYALAAFLARPERPSRNFKKVFELLIRHGLDVDYELRPELSPFKSLAEHAVEAQNLEAFRLIWGESKKCDNIREMVKTRVQEELRRQLLVHELTARSTKRDPKILLETLLIVEPGHVFCLGENSEIRHESGAPGKAMPNSGFYDGPDGYFILLDSTSLVEQVSYEIGGRQRTIHHTTRLPIELSDIAYPSTQVHISAIDVLGRKLAPVTLEIDQRRLP